MTLLIHEHFWDRYNTALSILTIAFVFLLDLLTPLGFAVWIFYLIPLVITPYKNIKEGQILLTSAVISALIWTSYFLDKPGIAPFVAFTNRVIMPLILWVISFVQMQRAKAS